MLIDQNRYIGDDPIGHHCMNDAAWEGYGYLFCKECAEMLTKEPERITFPPIGGKENQERILNGILTELK
jgi:hypothetical protein